MFRVQHWALQHWAHCNQMRTLAQGCIRTEGTPEVASRAVRQAVGGGYCRLQMPLRLAFSVRGTVAGHRLGALEGGGVPSPPSNASLPWPPTISQKRHWSRQASRPGGGCQWDRPPSLWPDPSTAGTFPCLRQVAGGGTGEAMPHAPERGRSLARKGKQVPASGTFGPPQSASRRVTAVGHRPTGVGWPSTAVGCVSTAVGQPNAASDKCRPSFVEKRKRKI